MSKSTPMPEAEPKPTPPDSVAKDPGLAHVPSPYQGQQLGPWLHFRISSYWFATNFLWGALLEIMLPAEVRHIAPHLRAIGLPALEGVGALIALVVPLIAGALSDRCVSAFGRRRPFIVVGVAINIVGLGLVALAYHMAKPIPAEHGGGYFALFTDPGYLSFLAAFMVVQFGNNVATASYSGIIPDLIPAEQRGAASGWMAMQSQAGTLFGVLGSGLVLSHAPESIKYAVLAAVLILAALITVLGIKETPLPHNPPPIHWGDYLRSLWIDPKKYPDFAWVWLTRFLVMMGFYAISPFINYYLIDVIKIEDPGKSAGYVMGLVLLAATISGYLGGVLSDRLGRKRMVYFANGAMAVVVLGFIFCRNLEQVLLVGVLFGLGYGAYISVDWALGTDVLPSKVDAGKEMAVWHIAMTLPQSITGPIAGFLIAMFGMTEFHKDGETIFHYSVTGYTAVFVLSSICVAAGALLLRNVRGVN